jgi:hypothetical protein
MIWQVIFFIFCNLYAKFEIQLFSVYGITLFPNFSN